MKKSESAGGVVLNARGEVLVVNQRGNSWSLPKGHIDPGEDVIDAARREIAEESGVSELELLDRLPSYERHRIGKHGGEDATELKKIHMFLFRTPQLNLAPRDPHHPEARWVAREKVADLLTHPLDQAFFKRVLSKLP
jgi:8-oxo-dGTP pyrophosphatase MutT (NUDIX family)